MTYAPGCIKLLQGGSIEMGMFDYIICEYPINAPDTVKEWQTKDTPAQYLETYKIDAQGNLWFLKVKREFRDNGKPGIDKLTGCMHKISEEWVKESNFRDAIEFYGGETINGKEDLRKWWKYSAFFDDGKIINIKPICEGKQ